MADKFTLLYKCWCCEYEQVSPLYTVPICANCYPPRLRCCECGKCPAHHIADCRYIKTSPILGGRAFNYVNSTPEQREHFNEQGG